MDKRVSLGGYYRLLSPLVIPQEVGPVLYMDVDAVILSNLQDLWSHVNRTYSFQASVTWLCSAFIIVNLEKAGNFWDLLAQIPKLGSGGDQYLLEEVTRANPEILGPLPQAWDTHLGHGFRRTPQDVFRKREGVGMLHFNGERPNYFHNGLRQYCTRTKACNRDPESVALFEKTWMLADYYVKLPWHWAKYMGQSNVVPGTDGYHLQYKEVISNSTQGSHEVGNKNKQEGDDAAEGSHAALPRKTKERQESKNFRGVQKVMS